jgi:hypothetical protein
MERHLAAILSELPELRKRFADHFSDDEAVRAAGFEQAPPASGV